MRRTVALALFLVLALSPSAGAQPADDAAIHDPCALADVDESAAVDCAAQHELPPTANPTAGPAADPAGAKALGFPASCRNVVAVFAVTINDTLRLGQALARDPSPCAEYYIVLPSVAGNRCVPRANAPTPAQIRNLGPRFHAVAEVTLGTAAGWISCVAATGITWEQAGILFRERMVTSGYRTDLGDMWFVNEFNEGTRRDQGPTNRANMASLVRGLYEGGSLPDERGATEIGVAYSNQNSRTSPDTRRSSRTGSPTGTSGPRSTRISSGHSRRCTRTRAIRASQGRLATSGAAISSRTSSTFCCSRTQARRRRRPPAHISGARTGS